ncbi:MAG: 50S ribosomal protein L11 methyltransferase [Acidimicrobiales bacterium]
MAWTLRISLPRSGSGLAGPDPEIVATALWDLGTTGVAETERAGGHRELVAGFATEPAAEAAARAVGGLLGPDAATTVEPADTSWVDAVPEATVELGGGRTVTIEVGPAFGHGAHPTTRLAAALVASITGPGDRVLDLGTGTGVLALVALAAGADRVVAVETDPAAAAVAARNLAAHHDLGPGSAAVVAGADAVAPGDRGRFALTVANLVLGDHRLAAADVADLTAGRGRLVLTGVLAHQTDDLLGLHPGRTRLDERHDGDWVALVLG